MDLLFNKLFNGSNIIKTLNNKNMELENKINILQSKLETLELEKQTIQSLNYTLYNDIKIYIEKIKELENFINDRNNNTTLKDILGFNNE